MEKSTASQALNKIAVAGLIAKGTVYVMLGIIGFMAAFEMGNQGNENANSKGVFATIQNLPLGIVILIILALGLICYTIWRFIQAWTLSESDDKKKWAKRVRYVLSGLAYGSLAFTAIKLVLQVKSDDKDEKQQMAAQILEQTYGEWIAIAVALIFAGIGVYQIYYGLAEKYKKHIGALVKTRGSSLLHKFAKIGYTARGLVWLIIAYLFFRAGLHSDPSEAGDTGKAFEFIEASTLGSFLLGVLSIGVIIYGLFNFIRARYDRFE